MRRAAAAAAAVAVLGRLEIAALTVEPATQTEMERARPTDGHR